MISQLKDVEIKLIVGATNYCDEVQFRLGTTVSYCYYKAKPGHVYEVVNWDGKFNATCGDQPPVTLRTSNTTICGCGLGVRINSLDIFSTDGAAISLYCPK